jgi:hypothetical protein
MYITVQLTSHSDPKRGETERMAEIFQIELKRNGTVRDQFLRDVAESIRALAKAHNAKFKAEHPA